MSKSTPYNLIFLIDDDPINNLINERNILGLGFQVDIKIFQGGEAALNYLKSAIETGMPWPDMILLDINMPDVDGWDFLNIYREFPQEKRTTCTLHMLTSSVSEQDADKARLYEDVKEFLFKPLTDDTIKRILGA